MNIDKLIDKISFLNYQNICKCAFVQFHNMYMQNSKLIESHIQFY